MDTKATLFKAKEALYLLFLLPLVLSIGIKTTTMIPDGASVALDPRSKTYASRDCVEYDTWDMLEVTTVAEAKRRGYTANKDCANMGGFTKDTRLIFSIFGVKPTWD